jgi:Holliday junction resolvase-like predicted endonuclease
MPWKQFIGTNGETRVKEWLSKKGFQLINMSWNSSYGEIDIIASFFDQLHFIAVTTKNAVNRVYLRKVLPEKKMLSCKQAAQKYMERHPRWKKVIFDILAIEPAEENQKNLF